MAQHDSYFSEVGNYAMHNENLHDCFFLVGKEKKRIGAVRLFLINQSRVWWAMLSEESGFEKEKEDIELPDIEPDIFILVLKHCYGGLMDCSSLSKDTVLDLCRIAHKYNMISLMDKVVPCLKPRGVEDLFPALLAVVSYNVNALRRFVRKVLTKKIYDIISSPQFLECNVDCLLFIVKQEGLRYEDVYLWKAFVAWAKHKAGCEDGVLLREKLLPLLPYIRLFTFSESDLCTHVIPLQILTTDELAAICKNKSEKRESSSERSLAESDFLMMHKPSTSSQRN